MSNTAPPPPPYGDGPAYAPQDQAYAPQEQPYAAPGQPYAGPGQPYQPGQHYAPGQQPYGQQPRSGASGLAVAALVVGIVSLLIAWVPLVNVAAILGGLVAVVLGALALSRIRRSGQTGKGLAVAGLVLGGLSVVASIIVNVALGAFVEEVGAAVEEQQSAAGADSGTEPVDAATEGTADPADTTPAEPAEAGGALPLGTAADLDEYTVTVTGINLNANEAVATANPFNEAPSGQYVMADVSVVYHGDEEGDPWLDLAFVFQGTDARQYDESSCESVTPSPVYDVPTLVAGGAADFQVCMDVPAEAIEGGTFFAEPLFSFDGARATWEIR